MIDRVGYLLGVTLGTVNRPSSKRCELDKLLAEESRWKRKATIAQNKLADVRNRINQFAAEAVEVKPEKS